MSKRKIFDEMMEGMAAMESHRQGKIALRTYKVESSRGGLTNAMETDFGIAAML